MNEKINNETKDNSIPNSNKNNNPLLSSKIDFEGKKNIIGYAKEHGIRKALSKLKYNFIMLENPEQLLKIQLYSCFGVIGALIWALVILAYTRIWYLFLIFLFMLFMNYSQLKAIWQQYHNAKDFAKQLQEAEVE